LAVNPVGDRVVGLEFELEFGLEFEFEFGLEFGFEFGFEFGLEFGLEFELDPCGGRVVVDVDVDGIRAIIDWRPGNGDGP